MQRHILSILVENHAGVLSRISGLFSRRCFNIESLSVGITENPLLSRITVVVLGDRRVISQIKSQVDKLVDVVKVIELEADTSIYRELALVKINSTLSQRQDVIAIVNIFRANIIDVSENTITVEMTGDQSKINAFMDLVVPFGIKEIVRTGLTGLERGNSCINEHNIFEEEV